MSRTKTSSVTLPPAADLAAYLLEPAGPIDWRELFGNDHSVQVEVGCGKGLFLITAAAASPKTNFFGIEIARKFAAFTAARLARDSLTNARIARADARRLLAEFIAPESVSVLHVYFPDPWWKRRHKKRRLVDDHFIEQAARVLHPAGELRVASDVEEYFHVIDQVVARHAAFRRIEWPTESELAGEAESLTNFERKYRQVGKPIYRAAFRRA